MAETEFDLTWIEEQTPEEIMEEAISKGLNRFYCLYSGGQDSACTTHFIATNYPKQFAGVVHSETGVSLKQTREFVIRYCKEMGWPLTITYAPKRKRRPGPFGWEYSYENFCKEKGFPGPHLHQNVMGYLKYYGWRRFMINKKLTEPGCCLISGVRKKESLNREKFREYTKKRINYDGSMTFVLPFLYKNGIQMGRYFIENGLKKSPAYDMGFNISGECMCGSFANPWERLLIQRNDPDLFKRLVALEADVKKMGTWRAKHNTEWGKSKPVATLKKRRTKSLGIEMYCTESCEPAEML